MKEIQEIRTDKLKLLVEDAGSIAALSRAHPSVDPTYVSQLLNKHRSFGERAARNMEKRLNLPMGFFDLSAHDAHEMVAAESKKMTRTHHVRLPILEVSPSAGHGGEPVDYPPVIDYMEVPEAWALHKLGRDLSRYKLLPVSGDSMSPTINDGDIAFVDTSITEFNSEGIYVIIWNDRVLIKRLRAMLATQRIEIRSDNSAGYEPETVTVNELAQLHIRGLVRHWWSFKGS